jgi:hypothetical protein
MVPKLFGSGKSFKKLSMYLLHDPDKAKTATRVRWTHTLNLASDHPASAVNEMLWTYRAAEELKRQAGVPLGGRQLENPVRHFSLNWHPSETPIREHMVETVESFLAHMKWDGRQALIVCHEDKHPHVHVMLNSVHPQTGRALDTSFEKRRAQEWALQYEREHELIFCEERLKPIPERSQSPTRATWERLRVYEGEDNRAELENFGKGIAYFEQIGEKEAVSREWDALKSHQREEREQFFVDGKQAYRDVRNAAYREVRTEFRQEWSAYYKARRNETDTERLATLKADIIERQTEALDERRAEACAALREQRDETYAALLAHQQEQRHGLHQRQDEGERSYHLLDAIYPAPPAGSRDRDGSGDKESGSDDKLRDEFQQARDETCERAPDAIPEHDREEAEYDRMPPQEHHRVRDPVDAVGSIGLGALGAIANIGERLFDGFFAGGEKPAPPKRIEPKQEPSFGERPENIRAVALQAKAQARAEEEAQLAKEWWDERRQRGRERD